MNNIQPFEVIRNARRRAIPCHCDAHCGEIVVQIDGQLPDGRPIAIMEDWRGFHLAIGEPNTLGEHPYTPPMTRGEIVQKIQEAMR